MTNTETGHGTHQPGQTLLMNYNKTSQQIRKQGAEEHITNHFPHVHIIHIYVVCLTPQERYQIRENIIRQLKVFA